MAVENGKTVKFHYVGKLEDGAVITDSRNSSPTEGKVGSGTFIEGIEEGLLGMEKGEKKEITISPEKGFGSRRQENVIKVNKPLVEGQDVQKGKVVKVKAKDGKAYEGRVVEVGTDMITLDFNHPLAG
ncbi:MAG: peptidylprolyl isomerase, partial [Candidatus Omnitrophota bacterium]